MQLETKNLIIEKFEPVFEDIFDHKHTHYVFKGGRGGTKSSGIGKVIPLLIISNPKIHATVFRKVGKTMKSSVFNEIVSGIIMLGLQEYFHIPKSIANPIVYKPTGQQILFLGLDDPMKVKSLKMPFGYVGITWLNILTTINRLKSGELLLGQS